MASEERPRERVTRKLTKKRREPRRISLDIPERFRDGDDAQEDVTAPKRKDTMPMNQSIFSMIARAGQQSQTDLGTMREVDSGDSEDEDKRRIPYHSLDGMARLSRISTSNDFQHLPEDVDEGKASSSKHRRALSEHKLLRSLPKLKIHNRKESKSEAQPTDRMSSSQILPPRPPENESAGTSQDERPLKHKSKVTPGQEIHVEKRASSGRRSRHGSSVGVPKGKAPVTLAKRLQQIFEFESLEEVISGMFLQSWHQRLLTYNRVPVLAPTKHLAARLYVHHPEACLLLRLHPQETCMHPIPPLKLPLTR